MKKNTSGWAPIHNATYRARTSNLTALLSYDNIEPNLYNRQGNTALHIALKETNYRNNYDTRSRNYIPVFLELMKHPKIDPTMLDIAGNPPIHYAAINAIKKVNKEIDPFNKPENDMLMLQTLLEHEKTPLSHIERSLKTILDYPVNKRGAHYINSLNKTLETFTKRGGNINELVSSLEIQPNDINSNSLDIARAFIGYGADPDILLSNNKSPFQEAAPKNNQQLALIHTEFKYPGLKPRVIDSVKSLLSNKDAFGFSFPTPQEREKFMEHNSSKLDVLNANGIVIEPLRGNINFSWDKHHTNPDVLNTMKRIKENAKKLSLSPTIKNHISRLLNTKPSSVSR